MAGAAGAPVDVAAAVAGAMTGFTCDVGVDDIGADGIGGTGGSVVGISTFSCAGGGAAAAGAAGSAVIPNTRHERDIRQ